MAAPRIEHLNLTVRDPARAADLLARLFGWQIRWQGPAADGGHTVHVGDDRQYLALYTGNGTAYTAATFAKGHPFNHVGIAVDDLDATEARVAAAGLQPFGHGDYTPGRRFYFLDHDGIEFEVVCYGEIGCTIADRITDRHRSDGQGR